MEKIGLYRIGAEMPWAEVETTQHNIRITVYEGSEEDCDKTVLVVSHDAPIRMMNYLIKGFDNSTNFLDLKLENGCILEYDI